METASGKPEVSSPTLTTYPKSEGSITPEMIEVDPILKYFAYSHLPPDLQIVSAPFASLAYSMVVFVPRSPERTAGLRKLLEAKDCFVRAMIP